MLERSRAAPLHSDVLVRLDRYLRWRGEAEGPLFAPHRGDRLQPNGVGQIIWRRAKAAGVDVRAHSFRRRFATMYLRNGENSVSLQALAGWSSPRMVANNARMDREALAIEEYRRVMGE